MLGLFAGLLAGLLLAEAVARVSVGQGGELQPSLPMAAIHGFAPLVLAGIGAALGIAIERRHLSATRRPPRS